MGNTQGKPVVLTDEVNLNHFRLLRVVGKGAFGKVRIVERKDSGLTFALKYIRKDEIVRQESVRNIIRERRMLEHLNHPFLCNLRYSFQDMEYLYLVQDLMSGGDLRFHISRKAFTEECVRFWMSELACALRYIHKQGIVHRDVKPDNILLDSEGHVHLADFNVASDFRVSKPLTSKSGTLAYLAPEAFRGTGYLCEVDWWSLGVTFYECIYGKRPYEGKSQEELAESICAASPRFYVTKPPVTMPCLMAMSCLMERDKRKRIGAIGWNSFTDNPFFSPIDFEALERKEITPVFVPSSEKTNFDATYDLEELLLEEAPLEARARKQKPRAELRHDATKREIREDELHRMIETMFEPFDYTTADYGVTAADAVAGRVPEEHIELKMNAPSNPDSHLPLKSSASTPDGSPPLSPSMSSGHTPPEENTVETSKSASPQTKAQQHAASPRSKTQKQSSSSHAKAKKHASSSQTKSLQHSSGSAVSFSRPLSYKPPPAKRQTNKSGGHSMVLDESGAWTGLADHSAPGADSERTGRDGNSVLGFLGRKKGRDKSPRSREPGVLGKLGSRQIIN